MKNDEPRAINLADYQAPAFLIDEVFLEVELHPADTRVKSRLTIRRNPDRPEGGLPLVLDGKLLKLDKVEIDGALLGANHYQVDSETLTIPDVPDAFTLEITTRCAPESNTALIGLYLTEDIYCTQCEAEGFRRLTYFADRPDVMATYRTRIIASEDQAPVLLSNGNLVDSGTLDDGRKFAEWHDPFPKPSYLFALVAGHLAHIEDKFVTMSGREVTLRIFVEPGNEGRCAYAMDALKRSFKWDEERFGREYDLDIFMVVAVSAFNMGAMENKGLNVFNDKYVLASPDTATDVDYENIEAIIAHEYFHNWTGNRITCRDWFQLCLKEGLTVFRDQEFTSDMRSRAVKRIADVRLLRAAQFPEDQGPLAHPVRPDSYIEINNFYTATVYEKGAELCRMIHTLAGPERFRKGMDLYFERHDGEAATVEDFLSALADGAELDLTRFKRWYVQAGTPDVYVTTEYNAETRSYTVNLRQSSKPTPGQSHKLPLHIPFALGLIGEDGKDLPLRLEGETSGKATTRILELKETAQRFVFTDIPSKPVPSLLRGFSAPVKLHADLSEAERLFLMTHDSDPFNRWEAVQSYATRLMIEGAAAIRKGTPEPSPAALIAAYGTLLDLADEDPAFVAHAIQLPAEASVAQEIGQDVDPDAIHAAYKNLKESINTALKDRLLNIYTKQTSTAPFSPDARSAADRLLRNTVLSFLATGPEGVELAAKQFDAATNMTDEIAALGVLANSDGPARQDALDRFYAKWQKDPLVIDKWLTIQSMAALPDTLERVKALTRHPAFSMKNPNRFRAVIGSFAAANPVSFHDASGAGYAFVVDKLIELDPINPQTTARLLNGFRTWRQFEPRRRTLMEAEMRRVLATENLSKDSFEICSKILA
ncbi:MAG: aminopeptidase N [Parvibaculaceae bacterium]|nr:aminopeptidase N [Parvibaculaceae bacterium]